MAKSTNSAMKETYCSYGITLQIVIVKSYSWAIT